MLWKYSFLQNRFCLSACNLNGTSGQPKSVKGLYHSLNSLSPPWICICKGTQKLLKFVHFRKTSLKLLVSIYFLGERISVTDLYTVGKDLLLCE